MDSINDTDRSDNWINYFIFKFPVKLTPLDRNHFGPKINICYQSIQKMIKQ